MLWWHWKVGIKINNKNQHDQHFRLIEKGALREKSGKFCERKNINYEKMQDTYTITLKKKLLCTGGLLCYLRDWVPIHLNLYSS